MTRLERNFRSAMAALGKVGMPEEASGDGAVRTPRLAEFFKVFGRGALAEALHFLDRRGKSQIADGPDVGATQRGEQVDVRGPAADAFQGDQHFAGGIVMEIVEIAKIEVTPGQRIGEKAGVESFLTAEADAKQFGVGEF